MHHTLITFPEIRLKTRDAHKLRGYFGQLFREHSPLLHNHYEDGRFRYAYPMVQYKVLDGVPTLVGIGEGSELLTSLFLKMGQIEIEGQVYPVLHKHIRNEVVTPSINGSLHRYRFATLWMALNQKNYPSYTQADEKGQQQLLKRILTNQLIAFLRAMDAPTDLPLMVSHEVQPRKTMFKDQQMIAFTGSFVANVWLPEAVGIGKSVSRGFGTVIRE